MESDYKKQDFSGIVNDDSEVLSAVKSKKKRLQIKI